MNFNCPVAETSESIEPNDNNLELTHFLRSIPTLTLSTRVPSAIVNSLSSLQGRTGKLKKRALSLLWKIPLCCGGIQEHKNA